MAAVISDRIQPAISKDEFLRTRVSVATVKDDDECPICKGIYAEVNGLHIANESPVELRGCKHVLGRACLERIVNGNAVSRNRCPMCRDELFILTAEEQHEAFLRRMAEEEDEEDPDLEDDFSDEPEGSHSEASEGATLLASTTYRGPHVLESLRNILNNAGPGFPSNLEISIGGMAPSMRQRGGRPMEHPMPPPSSTTPDAPQRAAPLRHFDIDNFPGQSSALITTITSSLQNLPPEVENEPSPTTPFRSHGSLTSHQTLVQEPQTSSSSPTMSPHAQAIAAADAQGLGYLARALDTATPNDRDALTPAVLALDNIECPPREAFRSALARLPFQYRRTVELAYDNAQASRDARAARGGISRGAAVFPRRHVTSEGRVAQQGYSGPYARPLMAGLRAPLRHSYRQLEVPLAVSTDDPPSQRFEGESPPSLESPRVTSAHPRYHIPGLPRLPYPTPLGLGLTPRPSGEPTRPLRSLGEITNEIAALHQQGRDSNNGNAEERLAQITESLGRLGEDMRRWMRGGRM